MKNIILLVLSVAVLGSCDKMKDNFTPYLENGEIVYTPRPFNLSAISGNEKVEFQWEVTSNNGIKDWTISYGKEESKKVITLPNTEVNSVLKKYIIENIDEGNYSFEIKSNDEDGNTSISESVTVSVLGENYRSKLVAREIKNFIVGADLNATVEFSLSNNLTRITEIRFTNLNGIEVISTITKEDSEVTLEQVNTLKSISYRTFYVSIPVNSDGVEVSIDQFASDWKTLVLPVQ